MKKFLKRVLAPVIVAAMLVGVAGPAVAAEEPGPVPGADAVAHSEGWEASRGGLSLAPLELDGVVGRLLHLLGLDAVLDAVLTLPTALVNELGTGVIDPVLGLVLGNDLESRTPPLDEWGAPSAFPAEGTALDCSDTADTCYQSLGLGVLGLLSVGAVEGNTARVLNPDGSRDIVANARVAGLELGLLGLDVLNVGAVTASSACTIVGEAQTDVRAEVAGLELLKAGNGAAVVSADIADDGALLVTVAGVPIDIGELNLGQFDQDLIGALAELRLDEDLLHLEARVAPEAIPVLGPVLGYLVNPDIRLIVEVGPQTDPAEGTATGLHIGLGLALNLDINVIELIKAHVGTGSAADSAGNLLSLDLATTNCAATTTPGAEDSWIAPGLT